MLAQRRRRWANIKPSLVQIQRLVYYGDWSIRLYWYQRAHNQRHYKECTLTRNTIQPGQPGHHHKDNQTKDIWKENNSFSECEDVLCVIYLLLWMDEWMDGWMDEWMNEPTNEWINK